MDAHPLRYHGTENSVRLGDRILICPVLRRKRLATVVYIPGQSEPDRSIGDDQWAYKTDDGTIYAAGYFPNQHPYASKRIRFVCRAGDEAREVIESYRIPPESEAPESFRDLLALIGCGAILVLTGAVAIVLWNWLF